MPLSRTVFTLCLAVLLAAALPPTFPDQAPIGAAWAGDDDDDGGRDDNDDDDDGGRAGGRSDDDDRVTRPGSGSGGFGTILQQLFGQPPRRSPAPSPPAPLPEAAPDEIVTLALSAADLATLIAQGFTVIEERAAPSLAAVFRRLRIPPDTTLAEARAAVRRLSSGTDADYNHYYRPEQGFAPDCTGDDCPARRMIGWPETRDRAMSCGAGATIGMVDTGLNEEHETFDDAAIDVLRLTPDSLPPSRALHGTAVAALFVGDPASRAAGLVPAARLVAVDAFYRLSADERADVFTLLAALDLLATRGVSVINLSLSGPTNTVLEEVVGRLADGQDIVLVAAVGNDGPRAAPAYPAAYPEVLAVTAVDRQGAIYRRAIQGTHVDIAAPGVSVWTAASISGARVKTGTSYAAPFVAAAAAILRAAHPELSSRDVRAELLAQAVDLGEAGRDPVFGAGLLQLGTTCGGDGEAPRAG